jgi:hypothetical protein
MAHKTLVSGTAYEIGGGKVLVGGTGYSVDKGRTLVGGTGYDISFITGTPIGSFSVGTSVYMNVDGAQTEFLIVNQGIPQNSELYDESCNGTWLLSKDLPVKNRYGNSSNSYDVSNMNGTYQSEYLAKLDSNMQSIVKEVRIPYVNNTGTYGSVTSGANGLKVKIFLLSAREIGSTGSGGMFEDGVKLDYFTSATKDANRKAYYNNDVTGWWLRTPYKGFDSGVWIVTTGGAFSNADRTSSFAFRPALILPSETLIDDAFNVIA